MSVLEIVIHPDDRLKQKTEPITVFDEKLNALVEDMFETMIKSNGVGLAGPQVGVMSQVLVVGFQDRLFQLINPKITVQTGSEEGEEGCLSIPGLIMMVERSTEITVTAQDRNGNTFELNEAGFVARIIQHEMDHLDGVLIIDRSTKRVEHDG